MFIEHIKGSHQGGLERGVMLTHIILVSLQFYPKEFQNVCLWNKDEEQLAGLIIK